MASIRKAAQRVIDEARDGIAWIVFWREGRGWESDYMYVDYNERTGRITMDDDQREEARRIIAKDPKAILVNSWVHNLGVYDYRVAVDDLAAALKWQYELSNTELIDAI